MVHRTRGSRKRDREKKGRVKSVLLVWVTGRLSVWYLKVRLESLCLFFLHSVAVLNPDDKSKSKKALKAVRWGRGCPY